MKSKLLIIDDDPKLTRLVKTILDKTGRYEVREENRSSAAFSSAKAFGPDMILLDVDMPGKDGGEVARELRADPVLRRKPVLFLTWLISPREAGQREMESAGMYFLAKPVDADVLVRAVGRILGQEQSVGR